MAKSGTTVGNLSVGRDGNVITLQLNTYHKGQPFALFTMAEIDAVIRVLKSFQTPADDDWKDLI